MRTIFSIFFFLTFASTAFAQKLTINKTDIDSLKISFSLFELTQYLKKKLPLDEPLLLQRTFGVVKNYYALEAAKQELNLLSKEVAVLKSIHDLNLKLANKGEISDVQFLNSKLAYLNKEKEIISKRNECRSIILEIVRLCSIHIIVNKEPANEQKKKANSPSDR